MENLFAPRILLPLFKLLHGLFSEQQVFPQGVGITRPKRMTPDFVVPTSGNSAEASLLCAGEEPPTGAKVHKIDMTTISEILAEAGITQLDYLSVDIDGHEMAAFRGLDFARWKPRLILLEDHLYNLRLHRFLAANSYDLVYRLGSNNWYAPRGIDFSLLSWRMRIELFRKLYFIMPFRKLRLIGKRLRGLSY